MKDDLADPVCFLAGARPFPGENRFILGTFERGVTVYRQQIRALNLIYALVSARNGSLRPVIRPRSRIVVIGGGAFGSTVAVAAAYAGFRSVLLERHQALLHFQRGCDTRWLHPRFYDWPAPESESQMARLPFLDWTASSAGSVAIQIEREITDLRHGVLAKRLDVDLGVSELSVEKSSGGIYEVRYRSNTGQFIRPCEVVVYGVGFGVEINYGTNDSYWRNDGFGQSELNFTGEKIHYVVSGFGDGGLVDLFRLTIRDFRYEHIFDEMFPGQAKPIHKALEKTRKSSHNGSGALYDMFVNLENGSQRHAIEKAKGELTKRLRADTAVVLNGRDPSFRAGLSMQNVSFSNALLAFLLYRLGAVSYRCGSLDLTDRENPILANVPKAKASPHWLKQAQTVIVRHGTTKEKSLRDVGCGNAIQFLRARAKFDSGQQIFPAGWWGQYVEPEATYVSKARHAGVEFVPPLLRTHATTFVSTVASMLRGLHPQKAGSQKFRVALHRLTRFGGKDVFQQVTPYKGRNISEAGVRRFFIVQGGIVGLACRTGSLVVVKKENPAKFRRIWQLTELKLTGAKPIKPYVDSLLCCPFFAPESPRGRQRVMLALFVDSSDPNFFNEEALRVISSACRGFVDLLESLLEERMLRVLPGSEMGYEVTAKTELTELTAQLRRLGVTFVDASNRGWKKGLTFRKLGSVDLQTVSYQDLT